MTHRNTENVVSPRSVAVATHVTTAVNRKDRTPPGFGVRQRLYQRLWSVSIDFSALRHLRFSIRRVDAVNAPTAPMTARSTHAASPKTVI